jgi:hypothetical protein
LFAPEPNVVVPSNVDVPDTLNVLERVVAPVTANVLDNVAAPVAPNVPPVETLPEVNVPPTVSASVVVLNVNPESLCNIPPEPATTTRPDVKDDATKFAALAVFETTKLPTVSPALPPVRSLTVLAASLNVLLNSLNVLDNATCDIGIVILSL